MTEDQVSLTAKLCSLTRAYHSNFATNKIFDDYLAYEFIGKAEYDELAKLLCNNFNRLHCTSETNLQPATLPYILTEYLSPILLSRIQFTENYSTQFSTLHESCQYVICGAGIDTFCFRNTNSNLQIFEIDHPSTQKYKLDRIHSLSWKIPANVHYVPVDFEKDDIKTQLLQAGFDINKKTFFSILGVTYYLSAATLTTMIENIAALSTEKSTIIFDYPDKTMQQKENHNERIHHLAKLTESFGEKMKSGFTHDFLKQLLEKHHFYIDNHMTPTKIQHTFFQNRTDHHRAFENIHFISAVYQQPQPLNTSNRPIKQLSNPCTYVSFPQKLKKAATTSLH